MTTDSRVFQHVSHLEARVNQLESKLSILDSSGPFASVKEMEALLTRAIGNLQEVLTQYIDRKISEASSSASDARIRKLEHAGSLINKERILNELKSEIGPLIASVRSELIKDVSRVSQSITSAKIEQAKTLPVSAKESEISPRLPKGKSDWLKDLGLD